MTYPKKYLSPDGVPVLAKQVVHEADLVAQGYTLAPEEAQPVAAPAGPPTCAKCAELEAKVETLDREARGYVVTVENLEARLAAALEPQTGGAGQTPARRPRKSKV